VPTLNLCARCGAKLRPHQAEGLCTRCLLESGLEAGPAAAAARRSAPTVLVVPATDSGISSSDLGVARSFGDYELLEEIARGGMGVVYRARQTSLERIVAIKMILSGQFASKQIIQRFRGEVTAAALLQHPNIVAVHDVGVHDGQHYFSMDYVEGQNLSQLVGNRALPAAKAARYVKLIAEAIQYAHQQGILHRDLKPSNVLVDASDQPRITDFGLAKRLEGDSSITGTGQMLGSPNFMPPEQASSQRGKVGKRSDVYGLGAILYHLLTARPPFQAESFESVIDQLLNTEPVSPRLLNSSVPPDLETICVKCLQKEPARRYQSAQELADELDRFLRHEPIHARPITRAERTWRWCRRKPAIASLSAATILLLLAVAIGSPIAALLFNRERQRAEENLYFADMHGAETALEDGDLGRARELVEAHRPRAGQIDLRDFQWRLLWQRCRGDDLYALRGYSNTLNALGFSPDGDTLATRSRDNQLKVWDPRTRTELFTIANVTSLGGFTPDGRNFAYGTGDGSVKLCDARTGRTLYSLEKAGDLVALLADGKRVATTGEEFVLKIWDIASGRETFVQAGKGGIDLWGPEFGAGVVITPDGEKLAISNGFEHGITLWDLKTHTILNRSLDKREVPITFLQLSADGKILATGGFDGLVRLWDVATGDELPHPIQEAESVVSAAFSPDGRVVAIASLDQTIKLWELATGRELDTLKGHESGVWAVTFSADGRRLASGGDDKTVRLWNTGPKPVKPTLSGLAQWEPLIWSPDSSLLAGHCQDQTAKLWDAATLETRTVLPGISHLLTFSDHGKTIVARLVDGSVKCFDVATGMVTRDLPTPPSREWNHVIISPNGYSAAITDGTPTIQLWDTVSGEINVLTNLTRGPGVLAFSPDGHTLINGVGLDGVLDIWDVTRRQCVQSITTHSGRVVSVGISPDGTLAASGSIDGTIKLWNLKTSRWLATLKGHRRPVWSVAFSPDGKTLVSGSGDRTVRLWNVSLRREAAILRLFGANHSRLAEEIRPLTFSPDGNNVAGVTQDGRLILLRAATLDEVTSRVGASPVERHATR
jgi:WD40 repeat protein/predicted Ser/Thr protein kinase